MQVPQRAEIESLSDEDLRALQSLVVSVAYLRFRANTGSLREDSVTARISRMAVGETIIVQGTIHDSTRVKARKRVQNPDMQWSNTRLANGTSRVERTR